MRSVELAIFLLGTKKVYSINTYLYSSSHLLLLQTILLLQVLLLRYLFAAFEIPVGNRKEEKNIPLTLTPKVHSKSSVHTRNKLNQHRILLTLRVFLKGLKQKDDVSNVILPFFFVVLKPSSSAVIKKMSFLTASTLLLNKGTRTALTHPLWSLTKSKDFVFL